MPPAGTSVAIYARTASVIQGEERRGVSSQTDRLAGIARHYGWPVVFVAEDGGNSGASSEREGLQMLIEAAPSGRFDYVLVTDAARLSRSIVGLHALHKVFTSCGVRIITAEAGHIDAFSRPLPLPGSQESFDVF